MPQGHVVTSIILLDKIYINEKKTKKLVFGEINYNMKSKFKLLR